MAKNLNFKGCLEAAYFVFVILSLDAARLRLAEREVYAARRRRGLLSGAIEMPGFGMIAGPPP
ncbi:MAG: hypothetical protein ABW006_09575, partial [Hyphomicrobium sp.]